MLQTQGWAPGMDAALERIRLAVRRKRTEKLTALYHQLYNVEHLRTAYYQLQRKAAPGIEGETWPAYGQDLERRRQDLSGRLRRGAYRALPVRRVYRPKPDGRQRPIGIPALEDTLRVVQSVTAQVGSAIGEEECLGFSYGFRPGRSPHNALDARTVGIERKHVSWVLDADLRAFFDTLSQEWLVKFIEHRIGDRRVVALIQKGLKAGVLDGESWTLSEEGTPQGGWVSPVLANSYLHYVFDLWVHEWRRRHAHGDVVVVRLADDFVVGFEHRSEAEQFQRDLNERLRKFHLELHTDKTRLIEFGRFAATNRARRGAGKPETFNCLGFTHICGKTRMGKFTIGRQTMRKRMRAKLKAIKLELKRRRHDPIPEQGQWLRSVLLGHYRYYGVPWNSPALCEFRYHRISLWKRTLERRSQMARITWERIYRLANRWLPYAKIYHPFPSQRLHVTT